MSTTEDLLIEHTKLSSREAVAYSRYHALRNKRLALESTIRDACVCDGEFDVEHEYSEGSYYDRSETITYHVCKTCKSKTVVRRESGGYG